MARRDPTPFGSRWNKSDGSLWLAGVQRLEWAERAYDTAWRSQASAARPGPEFFRMLRDLRFTRIRLVAESVLLVVGIGLFFVLPFVAMAVVVVSVVALIFDLVVLSRLRTRIREAWEDLALDTP